MLRGAWQPLAAWSIWVLKAAMGLTMATACAAYLALEWLEEGIR